MSDRHSDFEAYGIDQLVGDLMRDNQPDYWELVEALRNLCDGVANGSVGTEFLTARALLAKIDGEQP